MVDNKFRMHLLLSQRSWGFLIHSPFSRLEYMLVAVVLRFSLCRCSFIIYQRKKEKRTKQAKLQQRYNYTISRYGNGINYYLLSLKYRSDSDGITLPYWLFFFFFFVVDDFWIDLMAYLFQTCFSAYFIPKVECRYGDRWCEMVIKIRKKNRNIQKFISFFLENLRLSSAWCTVYSFKYGFHQMTNSRQFNENR